MKTQPLLATLLACAALCVAATSCSTTGSSDAPPAEAGSNAIPAGRWKSVYTLPMKPLRRCELQVDMRIDANGRDTTDATFLLEWPAGMEIGNGKFAGQKRIQWTQRNSAASIKRVGNKLFFYGDPNRKPTLVRGTPAGFSLTDYQSLGGINPDGVKAFDSTGPTVSIYEISGKDLILTNSTDGNRWLYKWVGP
jgi:hypothetical protein